MKYPSWWCTQTDQMMLNGYDRQDQIKRTGRDIIIVMETSRCSASCKAVPNTARSMLARLRDIKDCAEMILISRAREQLQL